MSIKIMSMAFEHNIKALEKGGYLGYTGFSRYGTKEYFINIESEKQDYCFPFWGVVNEL